MPSAFFAIDRQQAHPNNCARTGEGVHGQMRHGERTNKIPTYEKSFSPKATGNYNHSLNNRVNKPIAYIPSLFSISFQSVSFYSHYFGKTLSVIDNSFLYKSI